MNLQNIFKILFILLIVHNIHLLGAILISNLNSNSDFIHYVLYLDIILYALLAIFLLVQGLTSKNISLLLSGLAFVIWDVATLAWRLELNIFSEVINNNNTNTLANTVNSVLDLFLLAGIAFFIGIYLLSSALKLEKRNMILINLYGIVNLLSVILTFGFIGLIPKIFLVPVLGVIAYYLLFKEINVKMF